MNLIWGLVVLLVALWALGFTMHIGGALIHLLLLMALAVVVFRVVTVRGT